MFLYIKELIKHSSIFGFANVLRKGIGFFMIPLYTYYLTTSDYGTLELLDLINMILIHLLGLRIGAGLVRYYVLYDDAEDKREVFTTALSFAILLSFIFVIIFELFSTDLNKLIVGRPDTTIYMQIMIIIIGLRLIATVLESYLLALKRSVIISTLSIVVLVITLSLNIYFLVILKMGVMGILLSMLIGKIIDTILLFLITLRGIKISFSIKKLKQMLNFTLPLVPATFALFSVHFVDRFFVKEFCSLSDVGIYALGYKFGAIISLLISGPFFSIWNIKRFEIAKTSEAKSVFSRIFTYYSLIIVFIGLSISLFIYEIIFVMATQSFYGAASIVPLIVTGYVFLGMSNFCGLGILLKHKTKYIMYINTAVAFLNLILNFILIKNFGMTGAAIATLLSFAILFILTFIVSQKIYPIRYEYQRLMILIVSSLIIFGFSKIAIPSDIIVSSICKFLIIILFPYILFKLKFFYPSEIVKLKQVIKSSVSRFAVIK